MEYVYVLRYALATRHSQPATEGRLRLAVSLTRCLVLLATVGVATHAVPLWLRCLAVCAVTCHMYVFCCCFARSHDCSLSTAPTTTS